jgi:tetratricopeptide (TPR) repeat protein
MHFHNAQASLSRIRPAGILFAGALDVCSGGVAYCKTGAKLHAEADELFARNDYAALVKLLRSGMAATPDDAQLLWRLARALKKQGDADSKNRKALLQESLELAKRAVELEPTCGNAHKWCGIALSSSSAFEGTTASIKNSFVGTTRLSRTHHLYSRFASSVSWLPASAKSGRWQTGRHRPNHSHSSRLTPAS